MNAPSFIERDGEKILAELVAAYESATGKTMHPAQLEYLLFTAFAYRELLVRHAIQDAASQQLVAFSRAPMLDYLAELVGVTRLPASSSTTTIRFTLVTGHGGVVIDANTRVASIDGQAVFFTQEAITVASGTNTVDVDVFSNVTGTAANGYAIGTITKILDPKPFLASASNITASAGGADAETDDKLRERVKLAPGQYSTAGSRESYVFHAKSASADILDVGVTSPIAGQVNVYPLTETIPTPSGVLSLVTAAVNDETVRPLTDTVVVASPTKVEYEIEIEITIYTNADSGAVQAAALAAVNNYKDERAKKLGLDVTRQQLAALCVTDESEVYDVNVVNPAANVVVDETEVPICTAISITVTGTNDG